jgi:excisionase family DNA binding protein
MIETLESVLRLASELQPSELPHFLGQLEEARLTALARLTPAAPTPVPPDELLTVKQAAAKLGCSVDFLYKRDFPFVRRLGRKRLFSENGIDAYLDQQR